MNIKYLVRKNIQEMQPYSSARDEFKGEASVYLDANENPYNAPYNRYPDPLQWKVKEKISEIKGVTPECIFLGVGSDEPIDLMIRVFCEPHVDNIVLPDPTYGMYHVAAEVNAVEYRCVEPDENFDIQADKILKACDDHTKLIFLCSPNNPTGNSLNRDEVIKVIENFPGIVVLDEAYIDFSSQESLTKKLSDYPNPVILQTFSKAWGMAAVRLGMAFAAKEIIAVLNKIKYPYNINMLTQEYVLKALDKHQDVKKRVKELLAEREKLAADLSLLKCVTKVYPSDANFILVKTVDADNIYRYLLNRGIVVRNRNNAALCSDCLRITVGTAAENKILIEALKNYPG
ncbi:MAG: histidinol-phosphate transaminase [Candidatus Azobacteroides sp.]|nr:histidinol-phosphate transaminase [Candidatus Azobacteroides sp.]